MLLSDSEIREAVTCGQLGITPYADELVQPGSIDVRLDRYFRIFDSHLYSCIDPAQEQEKLTRFITVPDGEPFILHPSEFALASTYEHFKLAGDMSARLEGKSSLGRLGLLTHSTAGWLDAGFTGHVTMELSNVVGLPIKLWPGMRIGQVCFFRMGRNATKPYRGRYQRQERGPVASRSHEGFDRWQLIPGA